MAAKKIIPCMDIKDGSVSKGVRFENVKKIEDPVALARYYNDSGADELVFYDITASTEGRGIVADILEKTQREVTIPFTVGGGIRSISDIERVFELGADKVSINTGAIDDPAFIAKAASKYDSPRIVLAMDIQPVNGPYHVFTKGGTSDTGVDALYWAEYCEANGAGELVVNCINTDGVREGYDIEILKTICGRVKIPVVASGGAGRKEHFLRLFNEVPQIGAGLAASVFHLKEIDIRELKQYLRSNGIEVNL